MQSVYILYFKGSYLNKFYSYTEACEEKERFENQHKGFKVDIIATYE